MFVWRSSAEGEKNPLSARARSSQVEKRTVKIGVGLLPYVWIGSVWQKRRPGKPILSVTAFGGAAQEAFGTESARFDALYGGRVTRDRYAGMCLRGAKSRAQVDTTD